MEKKQKTILITGGSGGIGREISRKFLEQGDSVIVVSHSEQELEQFENEFKAYSILCWCFDLGQPDSAEQLYARCHAEQPKIDVLINNAGFGIFENHVELSLPRLKSMLTLNMNTLAVLCHLFGKDMEQRGNGNIINIGSTASFQPLPRMAAYAATKAFVVSFSAALAEELKPAGVFVSCVCPGTTRTAFLNEAGIIADNARIGTISWIADKIAMEPAKVADTVWSAYMEHQPFSVAGTFNQTHYNASRFLPAKMLKPLISRLFDKH
ncbi:MAG: SDR family oxidoreductase [SAR324 cluster bacterium]|nr:SDR family oxidoreductase [SAR324 cluster bacterium]